MSVTLVEGQALEPRTFTITRADLRAYAAASGDHNPIHSDEQVARSVGLPGVIAHGMYTLGLVGRAVSGWTGGAEVVEVGCRFTKPVVEPERHLRGRQGARDAQGGRRCLSPPTCWATTPRCA